MVRKGSSVRVRQRAWGHLQGKRAWADIRDLRLAQRGRKLRLRACRSGVVLRHGPPVEMGDHSERVGEPEGCGPAPADAARGTRCLCLRQQTGRDVRGAETSTQRSAEHLIRATRERHAGARSCPDQRSAASASRQATGPSVTALLKCEALGGSELHDGTVPQQKCPIVTGVSENGGHDQTVSAAETPAADARAGRDGLIPRTPQDPPSPPFGGSQPDSIVVEQSSLTARQPVASAVARFGSTSPRCAEGSVCPRPSTGPAGIRSAYCCTRPSARARSRFGSSRSS